MAKSCVCVCECLLLLAFFLVTPASATTPTNPASEKISDAAKSRIQATFLKAPLSFEANRGQTDEQVKFIARGVGYSLFLTANETVMVLRKQEKQTALSVPSTLDPLTRNSKPETRNFSESVVRMKLVGANADAEVTGLEQLPGKINYFIGNDSKKWRTNIPTYGKVKYHGVYEGVDLVYYGNQGKLEYDFVVAPGTDPKSIQLAFNGVERIRTDNNNGDLILQTASGDLRMHKPLVYQEIDGFRKDVSVAYVLGPKPISEIENQKLVSVGFQVPSYDRSKPLVIDPILTYSTYLGGVGNENAQTLAGISVDTDGNVYVAGETCSANFPTLNPLQATLAGDCDVYVAKFNATLSSLLYSTYIGGSGIDRGFGLAIDTFGNIYVTGHTTSNDFPITAGALQTAPGDAFVVKLNPSGGLVYSTYLGPGYLSKIAVDASGNAYVVSAYFGAKINSTGSAIDFGFPGGAALALHSDGSIYVASGFSFSVSKVDSTGAPVYSTPDFGGSGARRLTGIAVDAAGNAYVTGYIEGGGDVSTTPGAFQTIRPGGNFDGFIAKINPSGTALVYSSYVGGVGFDAAQQIAVDTSGNAYFVGITDSADFPMFNPLQPTLGGNTDAFIAKLNAMGSELIFSTYLGGSGDDSAGNFVLDSAGGVYVLGYTSSNNFSTSPGAYQSTLGGGLDAFIAKIDFANTPVGTNVSVTPASSTTLTFSSVSAAGDTTVTSSSSGPATPSGFSFGVPPTYYDVTTTASFTGSVSVCIVYNPAQFVDTSSLRLLHFENNEWIDVTASNNTSNNTICGQVNSFSVFAIVEPIKLIALSPAKVWMGLKNSDDVGIRFDLLAEVYKGGTLVGSGQVNSVAGGSSGFNNAKLDTIPLSLFAPVDFPPGSILRIKLSIRNACTASGKNSGSARLWYNDAAANSQFAATIGGLARNYFLRNGFALTNSAGSGPKSTIDVAAGAKCSAFKTFGTWSITP